MTLKSMQQQQQQQLNVQHGKKQHTATTPLRQHVSWRMVQMLAAVHQPTLSSGARSGRA
jgi:hypothetical protein